MISITGECTIYLHGIKVHLMTTIFFLIYTIISLYAVYAYLSKQYVKFIVALFFIVSGGSGFFPIVDFKEQDFGIATILILLVSIIRSLNVKDDVIGKRILWLILYVGFICLSTSLLDIEGFKFTLLLFRADLFLLSYFVFKQIPFKDIKSAFRVLRILTIITGIFFYLQFLGINGILRDSDINAGFMNLKIARYNYPLLTQVMFFYYLFEKNSKKHRILWILFFAGMIVGSMGRGYMITTVLTVLIYLMVSKRIWQYRKLVISGAIVLAAAIPIITYQLSNQIRARANVLRELNMSKRIIEGDVSILNYDNGVIYNEGTGAFRALMIREKMTYLFENPWRTVFGVGAIHESSPAIKKFNFIFGTTTLVNGRPMQHQIDTLDVAFLAHIMRYGLVFLVLYGLFLVSCLKQFYHQHDIIFLSAFLLLLSKILWAFGSDQFSGFALMFFILLIGSQIPGRVRLAKVSDKINDENTVNR